MAKARVGLRHTRKYQTCLFLGRKRIIMGKSQSTPQSAAGRCCRSRFPGAPLPFLSRCFRGKTETLVAAPQTSRAGMQDEQTVPRPGSGAGGGRERPLRPPGSGRGSGPTARPGRRAREPVGAVRAVPGSGGVMLARGDPEDAAAAAAPSAAPLGAAPRAAPAAGSAGGWEPERPPPARPPQSLRRRGSDVTRHCQIRQEMNLF